MTFAIMGLTMDTGPALFYDEGFRCSLDAYVPALKTASDTIVVTVSDSDIYKYESDLEGLLITLKVPLHLHWLVMRMNNIDTPEIYTLPHNTVLVPNINTCDQLLTTYQSMLSKK